jgi:carbon monoxide dehydrogenase subunit G
MTRWLALAAALVAQAGSAAEDLAVEAERRGEAIEVRARARLAASPSTAWQVLSDYESLPRFIPGIARSVVRERQGQRLVLEQSGEARYFFFSVPIEVRLEVNESPPQWIAARALGGNVRQMTSRYELVASGPASVWLRYSALIEPGFPLVPIVGMAALRAHAEEQFAAMAAEIERRAAAAMAR